MAENARDQAIQQVKNFRWYDMTAPAEIKGPAFYPRGYSLRAYLALLPKETNGGRNLSHPLNQSRLRPRSIAPLLELPHVTSWRKATSTSAFSAPTSGHINVERITWFTCHLLEACMKHHDGSGSDLPAP